MNSIHQVDAAFRLIRRHAAQLVWLPLLWAAATSLMLIMIQPTGYDWLGTICVPLSLIYQLPLIGTTLVPDFQSAATIFVISTAVTAVVWLSIVPRSFPPTLSEWGHQVIGFSLLTLAAMLIQWLGESIALAVLQLPQSPVHLLPWSGIDYRMSLQWGLWWVLAFLVACCLAPRGASWIYPRTRFPFQQVVALALCILIGIYAATACYLLSYGTYYGLAPDNDVMYAMHSTLPQVGMSFVVVLLATTWRIGVLQLSLLS